MSQMSQYKQEYNRLEDLESKNGINNSLITYTAYTRVRAYAYTRPRV